MTIKERIVDMFMTFVIVTACVTIFEGILGVVFLPDQRFGYSAFFSPPLFGLLSALLGLVNYSSKELTIRQMLVRQAIHLILIEMAVFGLNAFSGIYFEMKLCVALALSIAVVYAVVCVILWINDQRSASQFNQKLRQFQLQHAAMNPTENAES